jgi:hypothetical protein
MEGCSGGDASSEERLEIEKTRVINGVKGLFLGF